MVFKDRAACLAGDFLLPLSSLLPRRLLLPGRVSASISVRRLLSSCCFRRPAGFRSLQRRPVASADFLQRGAASTAWPPSLSTAASLTPSTRPPFLPGFFVGARLLPPPRLLSTRCVDCRIPYCRTDSLEVPSAPVRGLLCEGRGLYHHRVFCQPAMLTTLFRILVDEGRSLRHDTRTRRPLRTCSASWRGRGGEGVRAGLSTFWWPQSRPCWRWAACSGRARGGRGRNGHCCSPAQRPDAALPL